MAGADRIEGGGSFGKVYKGYVMANILGVPEADLR